MYIAPWLGGSLALELTDLFFSCWTTWLTRKNNNVHEPEFRLFATIPGIVLFVIGTVGWGWSSTIGTPWGGITVFFGVMLAGAVVYNAGMIGDLIDAHREWANESQVILFVAKVLYIWKKVNKNIFPFGMGYFFVPWCKSADGKTVRSILAGVEGEI